LFRKLTTIEIAEGALMADMAVVFQLLFKYLPVGGAFFALLVPVTFTILVLRRGFYAGCVSLCVAVFLTGIISGFTGSSLMILECGAGIFLGITMRHRLHYIPLILLGTTGSSLGILATTMVSILLLGPTFLGSVIYGARQSFNAIFAVLNFIAPKIYLGGLWHSLYPFLKNASAWLLVYWPLALYVSDWAVCLVLVIIVYYATTFLVRFLGYDVRPFPDGILNKIILWVVRLALRIALIFGLGKRWATRTLIAEIRRQNMGLGRQKIIP
jgi:hypothetical protein